MSEVTWFQWLAFFRPFLVTILKTLQVTFKAKIEKRFSYIIRRKKRERLRGACLFVLCRFVLYSFVVKLAPLNSFCFVPSCPIWNSPFLRFWRHEWTRILMKSFDKTVNKRNFLKIINLYGVYCISTKLKNWHSKHT